MINNTRVGGILFLILSSVYGYHASEIPLDFFSRQEVFNARSMPQFLAACGVICAVAMILLPSAPTKWREWLTLDWIRTLALLSLMWAYASVFDALGFAISTFCFLMLAIMMLGERRPMRMLAVTVPLISGFWLLMDQLGIYLSPGAVIETWIAGIGT